MAYLWMSNLTLFFLIMVLKDLIKDEKENPHKEDFELLSNSMVMFIAVSSALLWPLFILTLIVMYIVEKK